MGREIGPAGLGFGVLGGGIAGRQLLMLALSGGKMLLPGVRPGGGFLSTGQQGSASVDEGFRFLLGSFAAIVYDLFLPRGLAARPMPSARQMRSRASPGLRV